MNLAKLVVSRPTTMFIIFVLLCLIGGYTAFNLNIDLIPEVNPPYLMISTTYSGAGPEEVERSVTRILESGVSSVSSLEKVTSTSSKGSSTITMQFTYGTDIVDATNSVRDALDMVKRYLPEGAGTPMIFRFNMSMMPIMSFMITGNRSPEELRELADSTIAPRIEQTPGVAQASVSGGREKIIRVEIPQSRLEAYGLTVTQIQQMLAAQNTQISAGTITDSGLSYILTTMGEYRSIEEIKATAIAYKGGGLVDGMVQQPVAVRLQDLANIFEGYRDETSMVYVNGDPAVQISVQKQSGKNSVQTAKDLRARLPRIQREIPQDVQITELFNTTDQIEASINQVTATAISGAVLAIIVLFIFLRSIGPTLIIGISIPVSIVVTMMCMYFAGLTLNLMTLAGLVLGIGMLVDNSIVILENIYHYREKGMKLSVASVIGAQEMTVAILGSTLTTICIFAPMLMFQSTLEMAGEMFAGLAFTVVISLSVSLLVAIFLVPVLTSRYLPLVTRMQKPLTGPLVSIDKIFERFFEGLNNGYRKSVDWVLRHKAITIGAIVVLLVVSILLVPGIGYQFMPAQDEDSVTLNVTLPVGTPLTETEAVLKQLEIIAKKEVTKYKRIVVNAGSGGGLFGGGGTNSGSVQVGLPAFDARVEFAEDIRKMFRSHYNEFPGVAFSFSGGMGGAMMGMGGNPIDIIIRTDNLVKGKQIADRISELISQRMPEATEPYINLNDGLPQLEIELDRERLYTLGLNAYTVGNEIKAAVDGIVATRYKEAGNDYDVLLILAEADRSHLPDLDHIFVNSAMAGRVPLSNFASYTKGTGPTTIQRESQSRTIHVTAGTVPGTSLGPIEEKLRTLISSEIPAEEDVIIAYGGDNADMMRLIQAFIVIIIVAVLLVFGVMASVFESFRDPFIVLFTLPLSVIGVVAIYFITKEQFNVLSLVGVLVLVGVIVNNGIVLVDYTNMLRKRGYTLHDACVEAAGNRLRPILMSTLTTVLGLLPMAFFPGEGSEMVAPIGKTVFGGLSFGTLMTLFLMPAIYAIVNKNSDARARRAAIRRESGVYGKPKAMSKLRKEGVSL
ncbi:multidrug ABC transporter [Spirochaetia bacterium]|nr:multidrug ABC transporter [Spirochaetia bacterium]